VNKRRINITQTISANKNIMLVDNNKNSNDKSLNKNTLLSPATRQVEEKRNKQYVNNITKRNSS
jgi:hypothetical protein